MNVSRTDRMGESESLRRLKQLWIGTEAAQRGLELLSLHRRGNAQTFHGFADLRTSQLQQFAVDHVDLGAFYFERDPEGILDSERRCTLVKKRVPSSG